MDAFKVILFLEFIIGIIGILAFRSRFHSNPQKSILPVIFGFIILTLLPGISYFMKEDGFGIFGILAMAGFTMLVFWIYLLIELLFRLYRTKDSTDFVLNFGRICLLLIALLIIFLILKGLPIGKIGG